jgi:Flp pilus assembly protein TadD/uncharacterized protein (AIM24 family)
VAAPNEKDAAKAKTTEERTTERRMIAAASVMSAAESSRDVANEDFLFHLYRGSELLQDNRVLEAKEELEQALTLQPRDPKGQDLLAVVYFRIGLYPLAIQIYEQLRRDNPRDPSLKLNLALCYLKTGQTPAARVELEDVVRVLPAHKRAWGYLGLAHERMGDLEKASSAFERGGHAAMARRVQEKMATGQRFTPVATADTELQRAAAAAFEELDAGEISFSLAEPTTGSRVESGTWKAVELGEARRPVALPPPSAPGWTVPPSARAVSLRDEEVHASAAPRSNDAGAAETAAPSFGPPRPIAEVARGALLIFPRGPGVIVHPSGVALVRTAAGADGAPERAFAARLESIRSQSGVLTTAVMQRHMRGKTTGESFGGFGSPLVKISGTGEITLGPRASHRLVAFSLEGEAVFLREEHLFGFDLTLDFENGKLALGDGDAAPIVQLRGTGSVLLELMAAMVGVEVEGPRAVIMRHELVLGWTGKVLARPLPHTEAPSGQRGLISFAGEGTVLVAAR